MNDIQRIDEQLTRHRQEHKLALAPAEAALLCARLEKLFGQTNLPETRITSVYYDTPDGRLTAAARSSPQQCIKLRSKEYDPDAASCAEPRCVVEIKSRTGTLTDKRRYWVPRASLGAIIRGDEAGAERFGPDASAALQLVRSAAPDQALPVVIVSYKRRVFQVGRELRVTVDTDLAFHHAPAALVLGPEPLVHARLPPPSAVDGRIIVEVKHLGANLPEWISPLFAQGAQKEFSKFGTAVACVLGAA